MRRRVRDDVSRSVGGQPRRYDARRGRTSRTSFSSTPRRSPCSGVWRSVGADQTDRVLPRRHDAGRGHRRRARSSCGTSSPAPGTTSCRATPARSGVWPSVPTTRSSTRRRTGLSVWDLRGDRRLIRRIVESVPGDSLSDLAVPSPDGEIVAYFDSTGVGERRRHDPIPRCRHRRASAQPIATGHEQLGRRLATTRRRTVRHRRRRRLRSGVGLAPWRPDRGTEGGRGLRRRHRLHPGRPEHRGRRTVGRGVRGRCRDARGRSATGSRSAPGFGTCSRRRTGAPCWCC